MSRRGIPVGFTFIALPVTIVDEALDLSLNEYRLLTYLLRHQLKLGRTVIQLTQDELLRGRRRGDGSRYDKGCLISNHRDLAKAREDLGRRGWIKYCLVDDSWVYEIVITDENPPVLDRVQNEPDRVQNVPDLGTKCTQNRVQNEPAIIRNIDPSKELSKESQPLVKPLASPSYELDRHSAAKGLGEMAGMSNQGYNLHILLSAIDQGKRRWPDLRNEEIAEKIANLWKEYVNQPTHVKVSIKNFMDTVGRYIDSSDWRKSSESTKVPIAKIGSTPSAVNLVKEIRERRARAMSETAEAKK